MHAQLRSAACRHAAAQRPGPLHDRRTYSHIIAAAAAAGSAAWPVQLQHAAAANAHAAPTSAYIHLPFCKRKCFYCDFPVEAVGLNVDKPSKHMRDGGDLQPSHALLPLLVVCTLLLQSTHALAHGRWHAPAGTQDRMAAYVDLVCSEIKATASLGQQPLRTVAFGGGVSGCALSAPPGTAGSCPCCPRPGCTAAHQSAAARCCCTQPPPLPPTHAHAHAAACAPARTCTRRATQTPSLVPPELLSRILGALQQQFGVAHDAELSLEADPGTFDAARLAAYRRLGITRLSMGVQCFQQVRRAEPQAGVHVADPGADVAAVCIHACVCVCVTQRVIYVCCMSV